MIAKGRWPLAPFPEGHLGIPTGQQEMNRQLSTESACPFLLYEEVTTPDGLRPSWRATLGRLAYVAVVSIAMFGWLFVLWLALVSLVS